LGGRFGWLLPAIILFTTLAGTASAETAAETASKWGLIGRWSLDCGLPPDRDRGAVLAYEVGADGRLVYRRDFGDSTDTADVIAAEISADNLLNLRVFFPKLKQTREYGLKMEPDGSIRAFYNRDRKGNYSIRSALGDTFAMALLGVLRPRCRHPRLLFRRRYGERCRRARRRYGERRGRAGCFRIAVSRFKRMAHLQLRPRARNGPGNPLKNAASTPKTRAHLLFEQFRVTAERS